MRFVIIGGDAAGMSAASRAKRSQPEMEVTILEKSNDVSYSACGMPYNLADPERPIEDLVVRPAEVFREKQGLNLLTGHRVDGIDLDNKTVSGTSTKDSNFIISYDKLLIATGASPIIPNLPGFELPGVFALKSLDDGRKIKQFLGENDIKKVAIIGMGYIALEMCEALKARNIEVEMVKPRSQFLPWMDTQLADVVKQEVERNGVELHCGHSINKIVPTAAIPQKSLAVVGDNFELVADMVLVAIGVTPNSSFAAQSGLELGIDNSITVDHSLLTSNKDIYAAGDCADSFHIVTGGKAYIPLALRANRAGWAVADNICGKTIELPGVAGTAVFKVFDLEVARTGLNMAEAADNGFEPVDIYIKTRSRAHAHPGSSTIHVNMVADSKTGRLLGTQMVGKEGVAHRINAIAVALSSQMTVTQFSETDLAYAPPFGPVWDPLLTTANQLLKKMEQ
jgi:CoA-dependent NAD(P)H sulfur oxidoreductase